MNISRIVQITQLTRGNGGVVIALLNGFPQPLVRSNPVHVAGSASAKRTPAGLQVV